MQLHVELPADSMQKNHGMITRRRMAQDRMSGLLVTVDAGVTVSLSECSLHDVLEDAVCDSITHMPPSVQLSATASLHCTRFNYPRHPIATTPFCTMKAYEQVKSNSPSSLDETSSRAHHHLFWTLTA